MTAIDLTVRTLDQCDAAKTESEYVDIAQESLLGNSLDQWQTYLRRIGRENVRVIHAGQTLVGGLAFYRMQHVYGGQPIPAAGISGVAIDPAYRGGGVCATLLIDTLKELRDEGIPIASLYASTQHLYRTVGFEQAGTRYDYSLPLRSLPRPDRTLACTRFESAPLDALDYAHRARAHATNGNVLRTEGLWDRLIHPYDGRRCLTYLFGDTHRPDGYVILKQAGRDDGLPADLIASDYAANTGAAVRRLMALLHDHRSIFGRFRWSGGPDDPLLFMTDELWFEIHEVLRWMLRILDVPQAIQARGYPTHVGGRCTIRVTDSLFPANNGHWELEFSGGQCHARQSNAPEPSQKVIGLDIRGLATLYSGHTTLRQLIRLGQADGADDQAIDLIDAAFAGPAPWLPEIY
ncbi:Enhanced intracellular survival protein [Crateriforma conspicua]|uniref:Enhanced intracellular survival protein n=1 Tax=Crateriforma conspicua TaxID=2527996 RepID=A0A5C6FRV5_9PLAN|nr:GNAT family N-acetyltransferase [Crateriforma conspicua]TWU65014.1 Enhanced intracellular survival protein [Crateriforma conspicua]